MEQMKVSSIVKSYPNAFVVAQAISRDSSKRVTLANVMGVCQTKEEAFVQQSIFQMVGVKTFLIPTFEDTDSELSFEVEDEDCKSEPLLSPAEYARIFRQYWDLD